MTRFWTRRPAPLRAPENLERAYVADTDLLLLLFRRQLVTAQPRGIGLPKVLLEMVRCLVLVERSDSARARQPLQDTVAPLWNALLMTEGRAIGTAAFDQQLALLVTHWQAFRDAAMTVLTEPSSAASARGPARACDPPIGAACAGLPRSHPQRLAPYLRDGQPCTGLVSAAHDEFIGLPGS
jgi:hypothetical protein